MTKEELKKEAEEKYNERLKQNGIKVEYRNETYTDGYLDGAEPREKRIAELEKKNKELEDRLCNVANYLLDSWCRNKDDYCPHLAKLEKENAELKDDNKVMADNYSKMEQKFYDNFTKAKELLKEFVHHYKNKTIYIENMQDLLEQVEQFIKDSEVEK